MADIIELSEQTFVLIENDVSLTVELAGEESLVVTDESFTLVYEAQQGPRGIQGPPGPAGGSNFIKTAGANLSGHFAVTLDPSGQAVYASSVVAQHATSVIGITTGAAIAGTTVTIQSQGELTEPSWSWTAGLPVYLGIDGVLTQTPPESPTAKFLLTVGFAVSATTLFIKMGLPIALSQ